MGFKDSDAISRIRIHPTNPDIVFVADFGKLRRRRATSAASTRRTDGGKTWRKVLFRDNKTGAVDIAIDPHNPNVMFAAMWEAFRVEYSMSSGGPGSGLFKSTDGGEHWTEITRNPGLPAGIDGKIGVAVSGADAESRLRASSRTRTAGSSAPTTPARRGSWPTTAATSASARSTTRTSPPIRRTRTSSTC